MKDHKHQIESLMLQLETQNAAMLETQREKAALEQALGQANRKVDELGDEVGKRVDSSEYLKFRQLVKNEIRDLDSKDKDIEEKLRVLYEAQSVISRTNSKFHEFKSFVYVKGMVIFQFLMDTMGLWKRLHQAMSIVDNLTQPSKWAAGLVGQIWSQDVAPDAEASGVAVSSSDPWPRGRHGVSIPKVASQTQLDRIHGSGSRSPPVQHTSPPGSPRLPTDHLRLSRSESDASMDEKTFNQAWDNFFGDEDGDSDGFDSPRRPMWAAR